VVAEAFYTDLAEASKAGFYIALFAVVGIAYARSRSRGDETWVCWLHGTIMFHWVVGGLYSGIRMLTTDPVADMAVRRSFALEAFICFGIVTFHILWLLDRRENNSD
jgi:hypothetical protein